MKKKGIHTSLDTCAFVPQLPYTDLYLVDFKHFDPEQHQKLTGQSNTLIKENLKFLAENNVKIGIRIPLVPGCNDSAENLQQTGDFLKKLHITSVKVLLYHSLAHSKYAALRMPDTLPAVEPPRESDLQPKIF